MQNWTLSCVVAACAVLASGPLRAAEAAPRRFAFGEGPPVPGYIRIQPGTLYTAERGYGFEPGSEPIVLDRGGADLLRRQVCTAAGPFFFSVAVPEGNYVVTVVLGDPREASTTTVKAELHRLEIEEQRAAAGRFATRAFAVNVRTPLLPSGESVRLKPRERTGEFEDWDGKLTLEFSGERPCVCSLTIAPAGPISTVYLAGDSTVCDQPYEPFASWGQMLPRFFGPGVAVANHAESGESLRSFVAENRLAKLDSLLRPGDYLFIQFGHNDQKERGPNVGAFTTYKEDLEHFVADARSHGAVPVLITSVSRRTFGTGGRIINSFGDYPAAVRRVASEQHVALLDLNALSAALYEALGPEKAMSLFPIVDGKVEGTHHNDYGAYELAKCIVGAIRSAHLPLARFLLNDTPPFDPARPDPLERFSVPPSPKVGVEVPYGN